jgi:hypothetical protein
MASMKTSDQFKILANGKTVRADFTGSLLYSLLRFEIFNKRPVISLIKLNNMEALHPNDMGLIATI